MKWSESTNRVCSHFLCLRPSTAPCCFYVESSLCDRTHQTPSCLHSEPLAHSAMRHLHETELLSFSNTPAVSVLHSGCSLHLIWSPLSLVSHLVFRSSSLTPWISHWCESWDACSSRDVIPPDTTQYYNSLDSVPRWTRAGTTPLISLCVLSSPIMPDIECACSAASVVSDSLWPHGLKPTSSSVHGISQARILSGLPFPSLGSSWPGYRTWVFCISFFGGRVLYHWATWEDRQTLYCSQNVCWMKELSIQVNGKIFKGKIDVLTFLCSCTHKRS